MKRRRNPLLGNARKMDERKVISILLLYQKINDNLSIVVIVIFANKIMIL